ncbi:hypothetical protein [Clostridium novyi]|uniref:hypothetical protein n=1 Tax=Clostridium novyi TaxID=1542 RepID=UPI000A8171AC|nr:hypothetical protein [Clostridium novyi]
MLEVKDKEISAIKCTKVLDSINFENNKKNLIIKEQLERYKYLVMERGLEFYTELIETFSDSYDVIGFYEFIDEVLKENIKEKDFIKTFNEIWKDFNDEVTEVEHKQILKLINNDLDYKKRKRKAKEIIY